MLTPSIEAQNASQIENLTYPLHLVKAPKSQWPKHSRARIIPVEIWRSRHFFVAVYKEANGVERLSINTTTLNHDGRWVDGIKWDELQRLKRECGRGDREAVEIYPPDSEIVDVANIRHLWVLKEPMPFSWRK